MVLAFDTMSPEIYKSHLSAKMKTAVSTASFSDDIDLSFTYKKVNNIDCTVYAY
jgi:hypothetical protein